MNPLKMEGSKEKTLYNTLYSALWVSQFGKF